MPHPGRQGKTKLWRGRGKLARFLACVTSCQAEDRKSQTSRNFGVAEGILRDFRARHFRAKPRTRKQNDPKENEPKRAEGQDRGQTRTEQNENACHLGAEPRAKAKRVKISRQDKTEGKRAPSFCACQHWGQAEGKRQNVTSTNHSPNTASTHSSFHSFPKCTPIIHSQKITY